MRRFVYELIKWFFCITPAIVFVYAVNTEIAGDVSIPADALWKILLSGFLTASTTVLLAPREGDKKFVLLFRGIMHYAALNAVMIGCGCLFGWMQLNASGILMMLLSVAGVYLVAFFVYYLINVVQADEINQKLKEKYDDKIR